MDQTPPQINVDPQSQPKNQPKRPVTPTFPYPDSKDRLNRYLFNDNLFSGNHFDAFGMKINDPLYNKNYARMRYVVANFAGLISKVCSDMLFGEPAKIMTEDGDQAFIDALTGANKLNTLNYESSLENSRHGDALYKIRIGKLNPGDDNPSVIIESVPANLYFPQIDPSNIRAIPEVQELAWVVPIGESQYLRKEIHTPGRIYNQLWRLEGEQIKEQVPLELLNDPGLLEEEDTKIKRSLLIHVPNWRDASSYFGNDDYQDLTTLFYAMNNRLTKNDNILDKHSDPILALPEGVLDDQGNVRKESFHMFEIPDSTIGTPVKPEYIIWDAKLDASFSEIDKILNFMYMFSETSPDAFGMGDGKAESARALKLRLMRTIAKTSRKRLYYDSGLKEALYTAQLLAQAHSVGVEGYGTDVKLTGDPVVPEIIWQDGLPVDDAEEINNQILRVESGLQSKQAAIMALDDVDDDAAKEKMKEIDAEAPPPIPIPTGAPKPTVPGITGNTSTPAQKKENSQAQAK